MLSLIPRAFIILTIITFPITGVSCHRNFEPDDPYDYYESLYIAMCEDDYSPESPDDEAHNLAWKLIDSADDNLKDDFKYFNQGIAFDKHFLINPDFLAYLFAHKYEKDPRYNLEFLAGKADGSVPKDVVSTETIERLGGFALSATVDELLSFPHSVLGYRGDHKTVEYVLDEFIERHNNNDKSYNAYMVSLWQSGAKGVKYIFNAINELELNENVRRELIIILIMISGTGYFSDMYITPYMLDEEQHHVLGDYFFEYFFKYPNELSAWIALAEVKNNGFELDYDRLIDFAKGESEPATFVKVINQIWDYIVEDEELFNEFAPIITGLFSSDETIEPAIDFFDNLRIIYDGQLPEDIQHTFYPAIYQAFMTTGDTESAIKIYDELWDCVSKTVFAEWGMIEFKRVVDVMHINERPGRSCGARLLEMSEYASIDFDRIVSDSINSIILDPQTSDETFIYHDFFFIGMTEYFSEQRPGIVFTHLEKLHAKLLSRLEIDGGRHYRTIITNLETAGYTIPMNLQ